MQTLDAIERATIFSRNQKVKMQGGGDVGGIGNMDEHLKKRLEGESQISKAYRHYMKNRGKYKHVKFSRREAGFRTWARSTVPFKSNRYR